MILKKFGRSLEEVLAIGQGTGSGFAATGKDRERHLINVLRKGLEYGAKFIDTSDDYFGGYAEEVVGKALSGRRTEAFVATKFSPQYNHFNGVIESAENSLSRLKIEYIDLYQVHWPNSLIPIEETMSALEQLVKDGKVRYVGLCNFSMNELVAARKCYENVASLQMEYSIFNRFAEEDIVPYCEENDISLIAYGTLNSGSLTMSSTKTALLEELGEKHGKSISQIALRWIVSRKPVIAIPGTTNLKHLAENIDIDFELDDGDMERIKEIFAQECLLISTSAIHPYCDGKSNVYITVDEALENKYGFVPSPKDLADDIRKGTKLKPVKLVVSEGAGDGIKYDLVGGQVRYWGWVIANGGKKPIPAWIQ